MRKRVGTMLAVVLSICCLAGCGGAAAEKTALDNAQEAAADAQENGEAAADAQENGEAADAQENGEAAADAQENKDAQEGAAQKKEGAAILAVSFGTSYNDSRDVTIGAVEEAIEKACPEYEVRRAFTSQIIIDKLKERDGLQIDNVEEALDRAAADGIRELYVQPTHLMDGYEYTDLANALADYADQFDKVVLAKPLLSSDEDFDQVIAAITERTAEYDDGETAICFMGHGTEAESNGVYARLQEKLAQGGYENYYIGTVEAEPSIDDVVAALKEKGTYKKVVLEPLMVVAGDHANNDMAGDEADSWKSVLEKEGYEVECILEGLGQMEAIQDIYVAHIKDAISSGEALTGGAGAADGNGAAKVADGVYAVEVESSSSMFRVVKAELNVKDGAMEATITLSGTGYGKLYPGTAKEAEAAAEADCIPFVEDAEGAYAYTIPVEALDQPIDCAAFSIRKEKWYDRKLTFLSSSLSKKDDREAQEGTDAGNEALADGEYQIEVTLGGGSGKASVTSPASLKVTDGGMAAVIEWSSPNYDYMVVDGQKYLPVNTEGNSVFEIPVAALDEELNVIGDTVAMSAPHEVEYTLTFHSDTMKEAE